MSKKTMHHIITFTIIILGVLSVFFQKNINYSKAKTHITINKYGVMTDCSVNGTLYLSNKISAISTSALDNAHITRFVVSSNHPTFKTINGVLYTKDGKRIVRYPQDNTTTYTIPSNVKCISQYAFKNVSNLKKIIIPDSVEKIGEGAFYECSSLQSILLPEKITKINSYTFFSCAALKKVTLPKNTEILGRSNFKNCIKLETINIPSKLKRIPIETFDNCQSLKNIKLGKNITFIGKYAFENCSNLKNIKLNNDIDIIPSYAFAYCYKLKNVSIGKNTTTIESHAFFNCNSLKKIKLPANIDYISCTAFDGSVSHFDVSSDNEAFSAENGILYNKNKTTLKRYPSLKAGTYKTPETVKKVSLNAFAYCSFLNSVTLDSKITTISLEAFYNSGIVTLNLPASLKLVKDSAINMNKLKKITIPASNKRFFVYDDVLYSYFDIENYVSSNSAFWNDDFSKANYEIELYPTAKTGCVTLLSQTHYISEIPNSNHASEFKTTSISTGAAFCTADNGLITNTEKTTVNAIPSKIEHIHIGSKIKKFDEISYCKIYMSNLKKYTVEKDNKYFDAKNGVLYNKAITKLIDYPSLKTGNYTFPKTVTSINQNAFMNVKKLKKLKLSSNITKCNYLSLENCSNLSKLIISSNCLIRRLSLYVNENFSPDTISVPSSLISFYIIGDREKMRKHTTIKGFSNTCAQKTAKQYGFKFVSKGIVPKAIKNLKVKAYVNDRYVNISWDYAKDVSGYEIYTENELIKRIKTNKITNTNIYIGKYGKSILYIRAYNIANGTKLYSKAKKIYVDNYI